MPEATHASGSAAPVHDAATIRVWTNAPSERDRATMQAARLSAIKAEIAKHLDDELSVVRFAARYGLGERQVQRLFENEGTTFTEFVRDQRLARAHQMLGSPRFDDRRISDIALACGFGDLSFFNRTFRARYHLTPSDVRSRRAAPGSNREARPSAVTPS